MTVVLFGPWVPASLVFARSLRRQGIGTYCLLPEPADPEVLRVFPALLGTSAIPAAMVRTAAGIGHIKRLIRDIGASALVAILDPDLLWLGNHRHEFEPGCRVLVQSSESLGKLLSKCHQIDLATRCGLSVLPVHLLMKPEDADAIPVSSFPLVLRPDRTEDVLPEFKVKLVKSPDELREAVRACHVLRSPIIAQPFKNLPNLVVHGARTTAGDVIASRCYAVPRKFEGVSLVMEPQAFPEGLDEKCRAFAGAAQITGCYHLEFLYSRADDRAYFLDLNVRLGGTTDKVVRMGFDEPLLLLRSYGIVPDLTTGVDDAARRVANKRVLLRHVIWAARNKLTPLDYPNVSRLAHVLYSCRDLLLAEDSIFDRQDVAGSVRFHLRGFAALHTLEALFRGRPQAP